MVMMKTTVRTIEMRKSESYSHLMSRMSHQTKTKAVLKSRGDCLSASAHNLWIWWNK